LLQGNSRHDSFTYPDEEWGYYLMADRFGWTPSQVDELPAYLHDWLLVIGKTVDEVKAEKSSG
jgi:hypothetical protein